ncbi:hypothetical protein TNCV_3264521 [Trichonephila clavipes]|nr:hypothetical protein TNCV_3264521 [Trichonephila clavipes]
MFKVHSRQAGVNRGMDEFTRRSSVVPTELQAACGRDTVSVCVITTSQNTKSLRLPHRKKSSGVRSDNSGDRKTVLSRTIQ